MGFLRRPRIQPYTPMADDPDVEERPTAGDEMRDNLERQRKVSQRSQRRGRASTVLTQRDGGSLG